jgi:hypothetical protein
MIIEIIIITLSIIFVIASWITNDYDEFFPDKLELNTKKKPSQIDDLLGGVKTEKTIPKIETTEIECPGCNATMQIAKTGKLQNIVCDSCGLEGELEI